MTKLSDIRISQPDFVGRETAMAHPDKYHPHCGDEHRHKPIKAIIGVSLLILLSFLLYEFNGKSPDQRSAVHASVAHHVVAWNAR